MAFQTNPQLDIAFNYVRYTDKNIFLTGKAGTGKTTFLHELKKNSNKRMVVVAPTGIAAINAGGVTIHSFFQLPFGVYLPETNQVPQRRFNNDKLKLIRSLDLLVIDEISMVRADLLDGIDDVLRRYKDRSKPFGGVQLLMIGDLHQLPPIVKDEEWLQLQAHYTTAYFFGSRALQQTNPVAIELKHIYRQADAMFIDLLNKVRDNKIDAIALELLNSRYIPDFVPTEAEPYITLTSHNTTAELINGEKLNSISAPVHSFTAEINGDFPALAYPTPLVMGFKVGAQVMFVKNDTSFEKLYYNGKIVRIAKELIIVRCPGDANDIIVSPVEWQNLKYTLNETTKEVEENVIGTFTQYPLKLAWAITIHKSQGLTFDRAIIDANAAFAHGQVYVALSRCKTFEGIVLRSQIAISSIRTDTVVRGYSEDIDKNAPTEADLVASKIAFQKSLIEDLFDFKQLKYLFKQANQTLLSNENTLQKPAIDVFKAVFLQAETDVFAIADKFMPQIQYYLLQEGLPEDNTLLQERLKKAGAYFEGKLKKEVGETLQLIRIETDNKVVAKAAKEAIDALKKEVFIKNACFVVLQQGFETNQHLRAKVDADLDFAKMKVGEIALQAVPQSNTPNAELYSRLKAWRDQTAKQNDIKEYMVLPTASLYELVEKLPTTLAQIATIKGFGAIKIKQFGVEIAEMIQEYCVEFNIDRAQLQFAAPKPVTIKAPKENTKQVSFDRFKAGQTVEEIASERGLVVSTIMSHLAHFVGTGDLPITALIPEANVAEIQAFFVDNKTTALNEGIAHFGDKYSYSDLRIVVKYMMKGEDE